MPVVVAVAVNVPLERLCPAAGEVMATVGVVLATVKLMVAEFTVPPLWRATARMVWEPGASKLTCTE